MSPGPADLTGGFVVAQAQETRVPEPVVVGPLAESDLRHERRGHPVDSPLARGARRREGRGAARPPRQGRSESPERGTVISGTYLPRVVQVPGLIEVSHEQGPEHVAGALRVGPPADDEFLRVHALELDPVGRASGHVGASGPLPDEALRPALAGRPVEGIEAAVEARGEAENRRRLQCGAERFVTLDQRLPPEIGAVPEEAVEHPELDRHATQPRAARVPEADSLLEE